MQLIIATVGECTTETWRWTLIFLRIFFNNKLWAPKSRKMRYMLNLYLQLENLLLDAAGNLKVSDFGLSALTEQLKVPFEYISYDKFSIIVSLCSLFLPCLISYTLILLLIFCFIGWWSASYYMWNSQLCCSWGIIFWQKLCFYYTVLNKIV